MPDGSGEFEDELEGVLGSEGEELEGVDRSWVLFYPGFRCELNLSSTSGVEQNVGTNGVRSKTGRCQLWLT